MEPTSPPNVHEDVRILEAQLRECFGRVVYSHKSHEKAADHCLTRLQRVKFWQILLSAITTGGLIVAVFGDTTTSRFAAMLSAFLSTALLALNTYTKDVDPGTSAQRHKETAARLWSIRESYLSLLTDLRSRAIGVQTIRDTRDSLQKELSAIYESAPRTTSDSYVDASTALQQREELTFSDEEIDTFLPGELRKLRRATPNER
ncbi:MAG TPA: SLATT domain-containing protein [Gemmatimonadaceae bacterium]|nr:SLATT domain-containing protein [Gemmatimonadaceae bacterium]